MEEQEESIYISENDIDAIISQVATEQNLEAPDEAPVAHEESESTAFIIDDLDDVPTLSEADIMAIQEDTNNQIESIVENIIPEIEPEPVQAIEIIPKIETNPTSAIVSEVTSRFSGAMWYEAITQEEIILAGVGGIGSYVAFLLSRLNIQKLILFDDDIVNTVNLSGQLYSLNDVNQSKVFALSSMLMDYSNFRKTITVNRKYTSEENAGKVMICGFDNMRARKTYFNAWRAYVDDLPVPQRKDCLFIDGRLAAEEYQILCIRGDDTYNINKYANEFLFTDLEADATVCSYKQTSFMATQIASNMVNLFVNFVANKCEPIIDRYLPFYTEYNAEYMIFKSNM